MERLIREETLGNNLKLRFLDESTRYFGDYYSLKVKVTCKIGLYADMFGESSSYLEAKKLLGESVTYAKYLQSFAVPSSELSSRIEQVIDNFINHSSPYIDSPEFPTKIVNAEIIKIRSRNHSKRMPNPFYG